MNYITEWQRVNRKNGLCKCGKDVAEDRASCNRCMNANRVSSLRLKQDAIAAYGGKCNCCGESILEFLTIDHVNNDGAEHRKTIGHHNIYRWLKNNNYPKEGFRVLCWNCNCARRFTPGNECPHKLQRVNHRNTGI